MNELLNMILGDYNIWQFIGLFIFALLGVFMHSLKDLSDRDIYSPDTPIKFSIKFFYKDNIKKYVANIIALYIILRFFSNLFGSDLNEFNAFLLGFSGDSILTTFKKKSKVLQINREEFLKENL